MKALGLVVSDKKIFENCILKTYFLTPWPTYAANWNGLNNFDRGQPRDHSCEVWSKSNKRFQTRCCLKKLLTDGRTDARTDDGRRTLKDHKSSLSTSCSDELKIRLKPVNQSEMHVYPKNIRFCRYTFWHLEFWTIKLVFTCLHTEAFLKA